MPQHTPAMLVLADGTVFRGISIGAPGHTVGEVVFNTSMTGYQEILTDPSYNKQIVTLTYPHIGNTGVNAEDVEAGGVFASGLVIRDLPLAHSNWRSEQSLAEYLLANNVVAISDIDTRKLTRILREKGAQAGCIVAGEADESKARQMAQTLMDGFPGMAGLDLAKVVSCRQSYQFEQGEWALGTGYSSSAASESSIAISSTNGLSGNGSSGSEPSLPQFNVIAFDFGVKRNILRMLVSRGCKVTVLPAQASAEDVLALKPDGVFLANGPGDPEPCDYAITAIASLVETGIPVFGICLGHQLLALASGAKTLKMKFGHHGANHPVQDTDDKRVFITSQNHGFAVDADSLPANLRTTHISLFDGSLQGIARTDKPAFSFQGHPEASPGPTEMSYLFDRFVDLMQQQRH